MQKNNAKLDALLDALAEPKDFIELILDENATDIQLEIINAVADNRTKEIAVKSCHSSGKSWIAVRCILWFLFNYRDSRVIITAPIFNQVKNVLFAELTNIYKAKLQGIAKELGIADAECLTTQLKLSDKWYALGLSTSEHRSVNLQGHHSPYMMVVVDEASGMSYSNDETFTAIKGILASGKITKLLMLGNPTNNSGYFYDCFTKLDGNEGLKIMTISAFDTPNYKDNNISGLDDLKALSFDEITKLDEAGNSNFLSLARGRDWLDNYSERDINVRLLGEFGSQDADALFDANDIKTAINRELTDDNYNPDDLENKEVYYLGVDVARFGSDATCFVVRQGNKIVDILKQYKKSTMETTGKIIQLMDKYQIDGSNINIDEIGVGGGVVDRLQEQNIEVNAINVAGACPNDSYQNRYTNQRAMHYSNLAERFKKGYISIPDNKELKQELLSILGGVDSRGRLKIEPKTDFKARLGRSPDVLDALMLAFIEPPRFSFAIIDLC
ncbi:MAG: hypothetical protein OXF77_00855 [Thaumarchaeota archaeon]|nr:hypothetical protein [Nitrososphaerota archaeon]